jgi:hypothetical protein
MTITDNPVDNGVNAQKRSAVFDIVTNPTKVLVELA